MKTSEKLSNLLKALCDAKLEITTVNKSGISKAFNKEGIRYATVDDVIEATTKALSKHGLVIIQNPWVFEGHLHLTTRIYHVSDEWLENNISCKLSSETAQAVGSGMTYLRRYSLISMLGLQCGEDDDGNAASGVSSEPKALTAKPWEGKPIAISDRNAKIGEYITKYALQFNLDKVKNDRDFCLEIYEDAKKSDVEDLDTLINGLFESKLKDRK